jgi:hypothetical protein
MVVSWDDYEELRMIGAIDLEMHADSRFEELFEDW